MTPLFFAKFNKNYLRVHFPKTGCYSPNQSIQIVPIKYYKLLNLSAKSSTKAACRSYQSICENFSKLAYLMQVLV